MQKKKNEQADQFYDRLQEKLIDSIVSRSYLIESSPEEEFDEDFSEEQNELVPLESDEYELLPDEEDIRIILEREVHFSGSFRMMLDYYSDYERKGVHPEIFPSRIEELFYIEEELGKNIAPLLLKGTDAEKVAQFKKMYSDMQEILLQFYQQNRGSAEEQIPLHIVLLESIFSEEPLEELVEKTKAVFQENPAILYPIIRSNSLYDHLSPGYGTAPLFAIKLIGEIGDHSAIEILFEELYAYNREDSFEIDNAILSALQKIGSPVRQKMISLMQQRPVSRENEKAVQVLLGFLPDEALSSEALQQLMKGDIESKTVLSYLALLTASLSEEDRKKCISWMESNAKNISFDLLEELRYSLEIKKNY